MFERFTDSARAAVVDAQAQAHASFGFPHTDAGARADTDDAEDILHAHDLAEH